MSESSDRFDALPTSSSTKSQLGVVSYVSSAEVGKSGLNQVLVSPSPVKAKSKSSPSPTIFFISPT